MQFLFSALLAIGVTAQQSPQFIPQASFVAPISGGFVSNRAVIPSHHLISTATVNTDAAFLHSFEDGNRNRANIVQVGQGFPAKSQRVITSKPASGLSYRSQMARARNRKPKNSYKSPKPYKITMRKKDHPDHYRPSLAARGLNSRTNRQSSQFQTPVQNFFHANQFNRFGRTVESFSGRPYSHADHLGHYNLLHSSKSIPHKVPVGSLPHYTEANPEWHPLPGYENLYPHPAHISNSYTDPKAREMIFQWLHARV